MLVIHLNFKMFLNFFYKQSKKFEKTEKINKKCLKIHILL